ncbi:MAG: hypothetical protein JWR61_5853 [Ferruginibacter sp.]|uniref:hypothetical protein n=1 Tax=Ferruginibacter sp. TaxID=1940288 RepID=UPI0026588FB2|nr:hypothetical protein [Ferruginibacter sp.]MDB5280898.1 hypothetical protein [Ferruginibacter sp.]
MALAYNPPGVNVQELFSPSVNPLLAASAQIGIVGLASGYQVGVAQVTFDSAGTPKTITAPQGAVFQKVDTNTSFEGVRDLLDPTAGASGSCVYVEGADFTTTLASDKLTITITPGSGNIILTGTTTNTSPTVTALSSTAGLTPGMTVVGTGIPANTTILAIASGTSITLTNNATASGTGVSLTFHATSNLAANGGVLSFTYRFLPQKYYYATRLDSLGAIEERYGQAFDANGVVTPLSAMASIAFENGAQSIVCQPLFKLTSNVRVQPTTNEAASAGTWQTTLIGLRDIEDVNVLAPAFDATDLDTNAQQALITANQNHVRFMQLQGQYIVLMSGLQSATASQLQNAAAALRASGDVVAEQTVLVSPSRFNRALPTGQQVTLGGQYVAAAIAGMVAARPVATPITRKALSGFVSIEDPRDKASKDADAGAGLLVVESKGASIQVRHGLTTDNTATARRELSVVRAKHRMIESIRDTIDTQIIGTVPADGNAPMVVKNAVIGVLEALRQNRELVEYANVQARTTTNDPTTVECRFSYLPAFPLNYVNVVFSLDLSGQATTSAAVTL